MSLPYSTHYHPMFKKFLQLLDPSDYTTGWYKHNALEQINGYHKNVFPIKDWSPQYELVPELIRRRSVVLDAYKMLNSLSKRNMKEFIRTARDLDDFERLFVDAADLISAIANWRIHKRRFDKTAYEILESHIYSSKFNDFKSLKEILNEKGNALTYDFQEYWGLMGLDNLKIYEDDNWAVFKASSFQDARILSHSNSWCFGYTGNHGFHHYKSCASGIGGIFTLFHKTEGKYYAVFNDDGFLACVDSESRNIRIEEILDLRIWLDKKESQLQICRCPDK